MHQMEAFAFYCMCPKSSHYYKMQCICELYKDHSLNLFKHLYGD